jgi:hypothetical protein
VLGVGPVGRPFSIFLHSTSNIQHGLFRPHKKNAKYAQKNAMHFGFWALLLSEIQTTTTVTTTLPQSVFQSTKVPVPAWNVSNAREQMEIKLM